MSNYTPRGLYYEDFEVGQKFYSTGRTITESDIVTFAGLSGDYNQIHTDAHYAANTPYGQRIAHGLLVSSIASGLVVQSGLMEGTIMAFREINNWKFAKPTYIGDTISVEVSVVSTKALRRLGGGAVEVALSITNQNDEVVIKGGWTVLIMSRPTE